jgi:hypothetical protein
MSASRFLLLGILLLILSLESLGSILNGHAIGTEEELVEGGGQSYCGSGGGKFVCEATEGAPPASTVSCGCSQLSRASTTDVNADTVIVEAAETGVLASPDAASDMILVPGGSYFIGIPLSFLF